MLQVKDVVPGLRSARKKELRGENFDEIMRKHGESIRHGPFGPQILDPKSGLWRHFNDRGRTGKEGAFSIEYTSKKGEKFRGRCPKSCKICHGCPPGCFLKKRDEERSTITQKFELEFQTLKSTNALLLRKIYMIRMLTFVKNQIWIMSRNFRNYRFHLYGNQNHGFSLYDFGEIVKKKDWSLREMIRVDFQNNIDLLKNSTWRQEKKCVIVSARQMRRQLCAGELGKVLVEKLIPYSLPFLRMCLLKKLFGNSSIRSLIMTGQLNWEGFVEDLDLRL
jgi:hypothetical protein